MGSLLLLLLLGIGHRQFLPNMTFVANTRIKRNTDQRNGSPWLANPTHCEHCWRR
jgi:hypothetical protein